MDTPLLINLSFSESGVESSDLTSPSRNSTAAEFFLEIADNFTTENFLGEYFLEREIVRRVLNATNRTNGGGGASSSSEFPHDASAWITDTSYLDAEFSTNASSFCNSSTCNGTATVSGTSAFDQPALALLLGLFCVFTIFGNILVMVAVWRERYLHAVTNYFIVSLATADCLVGAVVMPFSVIHEAMGKFWLFGRAWCDVWHSVDVLGSTASILNLCVISLDRYWAITDPMTYPSKMSTKRACILIAAVWVCSALISFPAIAWWRAVSSWEQVVLDPSNSCVFTADVGYLVFSSIISFYGPLTVMLFTYYRIYRAAAEQTRSLRLGTKQVLACNGEDAMELTLRIHRGGHSDAANDHVHGGGRVHKKRYHPVYPLSPLEGTRCESIPLSVEEMDKHSLNVIPKHLKHFSFSRKLARIAKEQKAAKTLGIVMGVFVLCWMPFFLCNVLLGFCPSACFTDPQLVSSVVTWLGWINSGMNPVIYACWSRDFRRAFTKILCVCCPKIGRGNQRDGLRARVCHSVSTPMSSACSAECVRL